MNTRRFSLHIVALCSTALALVTLVGCGSDDSSPAPTYSCDAKGPCPNDAVPTADQAKACESLEQDPTCGASFKTYSLCAYSVAKCTAAGASDADADSTSDECVSEYAKYTTCLSNKTNDAGAADAN
ncbi:MAG: hypothetical protein ABI551_15430 [Polyangiaceae bacterium]